MSEELNDELAKVASRFRLKILGFGYDQPPFTGAVLPGRVIRRQIIEYKGQGVYSLDGISLTLQNSTSGGQNGNFLFSLYDRFQQPIFQSNRPGNTDINQLYDNLADNKTFLWPNDYLILDVQNLNAGTPLYAAGFLFGIEFLFGDKEIPPAYRRPRVAPG